VPSADAIAWETGANDNLNDSKNNNLDLDGALHCAASNQQSSISQTKPIQISPPPKDVNTEVRRLVVQGIPPEKAAQIISEKYGVKAEVYKVQMPSLVQIERLREEQAKQQKLDILGKLEGEIAKRRVELEQKGDLERNPIVRLGIGAELLGLGLAQGGLNVAESFRNLATLAVRNPVEAGKEAVVGTIDWVKSIPTRVKMGFTESPFFAGEVTGEILAGELMNKAFGKVIPESAKVNIAKPIELGFEKVTKPLSAKLEEFKPQYTIVEFGKKMVKIEPYAERPINIGFIGEFSKEDLPILKKIYEQSGANIDYLQKSLGIGKKELQSRLKLMQNKDLINIVNDRVFLNKNKFRNIPIGTIREHKPIWSGIAIAAKEKGIEFKGAKPISATVIESAFKIKDTLKTTSKRLEGTAIAKVRPRLGFELQIPGVDKIRVTTVYKNLLGKKAMIASEFTEEGARVVAKKGEEAIGYGFKILGKSPVTTQELTENPPIVISNSGRIARAWISKRLNEGKEFEIGKEITKPFDLGLEQRRVQKSTPEEFKSIETKSGQMLLTTVEEASKAETTARAKAKLEEPTEVTEVKGIPILDISKEVKALEKAITGSKPVADFALTTPLVVPPVFSPPINFAPPTFSVPTVSVETELVKPKIGTELFTPALNIGIQPMVGLKPEIGLAPTITTLPSLDIGIKPFAEIKPFTAPIEITTPKVEPLEEIKPIVEPITRVEPITTPKVSTNPFTSFKPISVPIPSIGIPSVGVPIISIPTPNIGFNFGFGIPSFVMGKPSKKKGKKRYIGLLAGYTEVTLTELLTGHKAHHLMVPAKMAKFWKETLASGGLIEVPTFEEVIGKNKKRKKRWVL